RRPYRVTRLVTWRTSEQSAGTVTVSKTCAFYAPPTTFLSTPTARVCRNQFPARRPREHGIHDLHEARTAGIFKSFCEEWEGHNYFGKQETAPVSLRANQDGISRIGRA